MQQGVEGEIGTATEVNTLQMSLAPWYAVDRQRYIHFGCAAFQGIHPDTARCVLPEGRLEDAEERLAHQLFRATDKIGW